MGYEGPPPILIDDVNTRIYILEGLTEDSNILPPLNSLKSHFNQVKGLIERRIKELEEENSKAESLGKMFQALFRNIQKQPLPQENIQTQTKEDTLNEAIKALTQFHEFVRDNYRNIEGSGEFLFEVHSFISDIEK